MSIMIDKNRIFKIDDKRIQFFLIRDIIATEIAGLISWGIYEIVNKEYHNKEITPHNDVHNQLLV